jgi:hypothetical protein
MLFDIVVNLGSGRLPQIYVVKPFGMRKIVALTCLAAIVEQKLPYVLPVSRAIVHLAAILPEFR